MVMTRRNYKIHAQVGIPGTVGIQLLTILDTSAGLKFIRKAVMPPELEQITERGALPSIFDTNKTPYA